MSELFDCAKAYDAMLPADQRRLGIAGLIYGLASHAGYEPQAMDAASGEAILVFEDAASECCMPNLDVVPRPDLAAIGVRACVACGCTDRHGCPEGCGWATEMLCTSCVPGVTGA